ncbi:unnamed protein product, partial [Medioppia subpectinata]
KKVDKVVSKAKASAGKRTKGSADTTTADTTASAKKGTRKSKTTPTDPSVTTPAKKSRKKGPQLNPKPHVTHYETDPLFESRLPVPYVSSLAHSALITRAVLLRDHRLLDQLLSGDKKLICGLAVPRSVAVQRDALSYAIELNDFVAVKKLMTAKVGDTLAPFPDIMLSDEGTGHGSRYMFGHALRSVNVGRGGREGNNALLKDSWRYTGYSYRTYSTYLDDSRVQQAIEYGVPPATLDKLLTPPDGEPDLIYRFLDHVVTTVRYGHYRLAHYIVDKGIQKGGFGFNELHRAVLSNDKQLPQFRSVSVLKKATGNSRITPLHCAAINPDGRHMQALLAQQPDFSVPDTQNWTPVHYAAVCEAPGNLEYLLLNGVSTVMVEKEGNTPLHLAASRNRPRNVEAIIKHETSVAANNAANTATTTGTADTPDTNTAAKAKGKKKVPIGTATASQSTLERYNKAGYTPLHWAAQCGNTDACKALIRGGADIERRTTAVKDKLSALMVAAESGRLSVVKLLTEYGAQADARDKRCRTALTHAVMNGHSHVVSHLLRLGADHTAKDSSGNSLVHYACAYGWYYCFKLLREAEAPLNECNDWKMTPLCIAFMKGHTGLAEEVVKESGANIDMPVNDTT